METKKLKTLMKYINRTLSIVALTAISLVALLVPHIGIPLATMVLTISVGGIATVLGFTAYKESKEPKDNKEA